MTPNIRKVVAGAALVGALIAGAPVHAAPSNGLIRVVTVGGGPSAVAVDAPLHRAYVVNSGDNTVSVLDAHSGLVLRTVTLGAAPVRRDYSYIAAADSRTSRVFVVIQRHPPAAGSVAVLDAASGRIIRTTVVGMFPAAVAVDEQTSRAFVTNLDSSTVSVLDSRTGVSLRTARVGNGPGGVSVDERTGRVFVANSDGSISMLDARTGAPLRSIGVGRRLQGFTTILAGPAGRVFVFYQSGRVTILDAATGRIVRTIGLGVFPGGAAADARSSHLFVAMTGPNGGGYSVNMLDARTGALLRTASVGRGPLGVVVDAGTSRAYVANYTGQSVSVLDSRSGAVLRTIPAANPFAMALDPQAHRVFAVNFTGLRKGSVAVLDSRV